MILAVCLNPALDVTYPVDALTPGASHRVGEPVVRAGGKGTNVARVLAQLRADCVLLAPLGGNGATVFRTDLDRAGIAYEAVSVAGDTRRSVAVVDPDDATVFNEPGPALDEAEWSAVRESFTRLLSRADTVVLAGSCPPGVPVDAYAQLIAAASAAGVRTVLDADGDALRTGLAAGPDVVKINEHEAAAAFATAQAPDSAAALLAAGAGTAVITCGGAGVLARHGSSTVRASLPFRVAGNPTGAGDALTGALAHQLTSRASLPEALAEAVAVAAAAVAVPYAGGFDDGLATRLRPRVIVTLEDE